MRHQRHVLTDTDITRQVTLQLPELDFYYMSNHDQPMDRDVAQAFCAEYRKIAPTSFVSEGLLRVDFYPSPRRFASWNYGASRQRPHASRTDPLCLVALQQLCFFTSCDVLERDGREAIVIGNPYVAMYGKGAGAPPNEQMLPVPTLPATAASGYVMTYASDVQEVIIFMDGSAIVTEHPM